MELGSFPITVWRKSLSAYRACLSDSLALNFIYELQLFLRTLFRRQRNTKSWPEDAPKSAPTMLRVSGLLVRPLMPTQLLESQRAW